LTKVAGCVGAALCVLALTAATVRAQQSAPAPPVNRDAFGEMRERRQREAVLRSAETVPPESATDKRSLLAAVEQTRQDFKRIQILRNELVRSLLDDKPLDYKSIADKSGEINKRALRLRTHLSAYKPEDEEKERKTQIEFGGEQMKDALVTLCKRIETFVESPIFKTPGVVDLQESARANRDLQSIIQLSGGIRKGADRLTKTPK
jgi:hypothetical protein